ncbi:MAG: glycosyltransferase family 2 protein [Candidatus Omnitrophota bacterium]
MKTCILIPTYNEEKSIGQLIKQIKTQNFDVLVIDDGSKDKTKDIAIKEGAIVLENKINLGKGASLRKGFEYLLSKDYDLAIIMDGDGQHSPDDINKFILKANDPQIGIVIGNRLLKPKNMPFVRLLTNKLMSVWISKLCKQNIPDSQCGYRLIKKDVLNRIRLKSQNFEIESELLIEAARSGFKIDSVPIASIYQNHKSRINPILDTIRFIKFIFNKL